MSDHYDYAIHCEFSHLLPQPVIDTLRYMTRTEDYPFDAPLDHPFFAAQDFGDAGVYEPWRTLLQSDWGGRFAMICALTQPGGRTPALKPILTRSRH